MSQVDTNEHDDNFQRADDQGPEVLNIEQLNYARELIAKKRPMTDIHISKVWPWFRHCMCCCKPKPNFKLALKKSLLNKLDMKIPKSDMALDEDPFLQVGYGINAYFDVISQLAWMFCVISIVMLPTMFKFAEYGGLKDISPMYVLDQYTMGNMGGASVLCSNVPNNIEGVQLSLSCPSGQLNLAATGHETGATIYDFGIIPSTTTDKDYCQKSALPTDATNCMPWFNSAAFQTAMSTSCDNGTTCNIGDLPSYTLKSYTDSNGNIQNIPASCSSQQSMLFVQVACTYTEEQLTDRQIFGLYNACVGVFISLFMIVYVDYIRSVQANNYVEWDVKTITAGDYSIEFDITESFYKRFLDGRGNVNNPKIDDEVEFEWDDNKTHAENFRIWIQNQIELRMSKLPDLGYEAEPQDHIDVAVTSLAYDNSKLIGLLRDRGAHIIAEKWDKMREVDNKINEMKKTDLDAWCTPVSVFITFQLEEGLQRALNFQEVIEGVNSEEYSYLNEWFNGEEHIEIQPASEPSDIIWENRHFTPTERLKKAVCVGITIFFMLLGSFVVIFMSQKWSYDFMEVYPVVSCKEYDIYPTNVLGQLALGEYAANQQLEKTQKVSYSGYVQCYCQETVTDTTLPTEFSFTYADGETETFDNICTQYFNNVWIVLAMTNFITGFIVVVNTIIKTLVISLITWIGYDTQSEMLVKITNGVFISLFFNTGFLLILANANWSQYSLPLKNWFNGPFDDYSPNWYVFVANTFTQTMIINCFFNTGFQMAMDALTWFFRRSDQKWAKTEEEKLKTTKKTQIGQYVALFQGDAYIVHFKFSMVFNAVFCTMLYGMGIPSLFPIAIMGLVIFWALERYCVAYTYQKPPSLDDRLTKNAVDLLLKAPLFFVCNSFWMLTNTQIYYGWVNPIARQKDHMVTGHTVGETMQVNQASPLFLLLIALTIIIILESYFKDYLTKWGFSLSSNEIDVDENLPDFYKAVKLSDADWMVKEQEYYVNEYNLKIVEPELAEKMDEVGRPKKAVQGIAWYNVLANPDYITAFNYINCNVPSRSNLIVDDDDDEDNDNEQSDTVQVALNLGVLNKEIALNMPFGKGMMSYMRQFKENKA